MLRQLIFPRFAARAWGLRWAVLAASVAHAAYVGAGSEPVAPSHGAEGRPEVQSEDLRAWGVSGNCIESHRIRNIRFRDDESAIIQVTGGRRVLMTLERRCPGIRSRGFLHHTRINRLCTSDALRVIDTGSICMIGDFTPYIEDGDAEGESGAAAPHRTSG